MRRPAQIERLYLDFDGFFASVEQQARPHLRGRPVGVVPFAEAERTCVIACSREAKLRGVKNVMTIGEARARCPEILLVPQSPDLYRRAHNALISEITAVIPVDAVKSIDELTCRVAPADRDAPEALGRRIKARLAENIGPHILCSIGFAANRQLAKMACKAGKPNGNMVWHPKDMPAPLLRLELKDIPGVGSHMEQKLLRTGITSMEALLATQPKHMRKLWGNVTGERLWYAEATLEYGWSRPVLAAQIQTRLRDRQGHAITNFDRALPPSASDLAQQVLKDPYQFDFLTLAADTKERDLERGLVTRVKDLLLEMGKGFAFLGSQHHLEIGGQDWYIDLLFYHRRLRCLVAVDLKIGAFQPEHAGKMNFYLAALDDRDRDPGDNPSIGLILCRERNRVVVEYALRSVNSPIGVAEYKLLLAAALPAALAEALPTSEELETGMSLPADGNGAS